jgi:7,8-dihydroneopterin aldolase/epimerase/oxygenase
MSDTVFLRGLEVDCIIGVFDWEREQKQKVVIDLDMDWDIGPAARDDDLAKAVDWKAVTKAVLDLVGPSTFELVETLAERIAGMVVTGFGVPRIRVRVQKPGAVRYSATVGVDIVRTAADFPA